MHLNPHCPLRKGIIYYCRKNTIFEHNIRSSSKREPRIVARNQFKATSFQDLTTVNDTEHLSDAVLSLGVRGSRYFEFIPINGNRMLLFARSSFRTKDEVVAQYCLHLSIHEICSSRFGPALWTYHGDGHSSIPMLHWMKSTTNTLGIAFGLRCKGHTELFDIDLEGNYPLIEVGRMNYDQRFSDGAAQSPNRNILLSVVNQPEWGAEKINILYSDTGDANNMDFSFVTSVSIPKLANADRQPPMRPLVLFLEFSADGSKFATATSDGVLSVWDVRSQIPLMVLAVEKQRFVNEPITFLKFSKGISGRELLVFMENALLHKIIHVIDATSFATREIFVLPIDYSYSRRQEETAALFLDPRGESLYVLLDGILYEWEMRKNEGSEWWIGE